MSKPHYRSFWTGCHTEKQLERRTRRVQQQLIERLGPLAGKRIRFRNIKEYEPGKPKEWTYGTLAVQPEQFHGGPRQWGYRIDLTGRDYTSITIEEYYSYPQLEIEEVP